MRTKTNPFHMLIVAAFLSLAFFACSKKDTTTTQVVDESSQSTVARSVYSQRSTNFDWSDGAYTQARANADFGNMTFYTHPENLYISSHTLRAKLNKNSDGGACGPITKVNIAKGGKYEVKFRVRFHSAFNFVLGGKCGFGLLIGPGKNTGGAKPTGDGGSVRIVWRKQNNGDIKLRPYVYYYDQTTNYGDMFGNLGAMYPLADGVSIQRGVWYDVIIRVFMNTGNSKNGVCYVNINGTTILYKKDIRYTTSDAYAYMDAMSFDSFYGGDGSEYWSATDGLIYYDDVSFTRL